MNLDFGILHISLMSLITPNGGAVMPRSILQFLVVLSLAACRTKLASVPLRSARSPFRLLAPRLHSADAAEDEQLIIRPSIAEGVGLIGSHTRTYSDDPHGLSQQNSQQNSLPVEHMQHMQQRGACPQGITITGLTAYLA